MKKYEIQYLTEYVNDRLKNCEIFNLKYDNYYKAVTFDIIFKTLTQSCKVNCNKTNNVVLIGSEIVSYLKQFILDYYFQI